jgi:hypothetical protein
MWVYRLEDEHGRGPYIGGRSDKIADASYKMWSAHNNGSHRPGPRFEQGGYHIRDNERSGCESREKLKKWFEHFYDGLLEEGFKVKAYNVRKDRVRKCTDGMQLAFVRPGEER